MYDYFKFCATISFENYIKVGTINLWLDCLPKPCKKES